MSIFQEMESAVASYSRSFPVVFERAKGASLFTRDGKAYLDFLAGAGSLNYGHNNPVCKQALMDYLAADGVTHGLDMHTAAKERFMEAFSNQILTPRNMEYRMQFTGPTGTNAVEAALKLARKVTGRHTVVSFTNGFHGVSLGSVATTGNEHHRGGAGLPLPGVTFMPYDGYFGKDVDSAKLFERMLRDKSSGLDHPAAVIVECVQGEGGLNVASSEWLSKIEQLCREHDMLMIVDDIQAGCGRTGTFFSFEPAGIKPDIITLSKSLSAYGLPLAVVLMRPDLDEWKPGEHNGTFRGNNHAFVTAAAALEAYWTDETFAASVRSKGEHLGKRLQRMVDQYGESNMRVKGRGMMRGISCRDGSVAGRITRACFERGLVIETSGNESHVVKCLMPLTISQEDLDAGLDILEAAMAEVMPTTLRRVS
jgi:diaminobutyrate-2-oxoglutarate transaminase